MGVPLLLLLEHPMTFSVELCGPRRQAGCVLCRCALRAEGGTNKQAKTSDRLSIGRVGSSGKKINGIEIMTMIKNVIFIHDKIYAW